MTLNKNFKISQISEAFRDVTPIDGNLRRKKR